MARDWTSTIELALRLIANNGRVVQFVKNAPAVPDSTKPWRTTAADEQTVSLPAVFVPAGGTPLFGFEMMEDELFKKAMQIALVAPEVGATYDLTTFHQVVEPTGRVWRYSGSNKLQPGDTALLYAIGMAE